MTDIKQMLEQKNRDKIAMRRGEEVHDKLRSSAPENASPEIARFWAPGARTEVPIAGNINGKFVSRRIDRMIVSDSAVEFLDYKTDINDARRDQYVRQLTEYAHLLGRALPGRDVRGYILWTRDWRLDRVV